MTRLSVIMIEEEKEMTRMSPTKKVALLSIMMLLLQSFLAVDVFGANIDVSIKATDNNQELDYKELKLGESTEVYAAASGENPIKTASWTSGSSAILGVIENGEKATLYGKNEGSTKAIVDVTTADNKTGEKYCIVSIYKEVPKAAGKIKSDDANLRYAASSNADTRKVAHNGQELTITATCGAYYRVEMPSGYFGDGKGNEIAYILKDRVSVPAASVQITPDPLHISIGEVSTLTGKVMPELADNKSLSWTSENPDIAKVDASGNVTAKRSGETKIIASVKGSDLKGECWVKVEQAKVKVEINYIGFKDIVLEWEPLPGAIKYEIEKYNEATNQYTLVKIIENPATHSWKSKDRADGEGGSYRIRAVYENDMYSGYGAAEIDVAPKLVSPLKTSAKIRLKWENVKGADGYTVAQYSPSKKAYKTIKTIHSSSTKHYNVSGLASSKTYTFKVRPFIMKDGKKVNYAYSNPLKVKTHNKTNGYFYNKVNWKKDWPGIKITSGKASNKTMNEHTVKNGKPFVKYNYSTKNQTLYIHVYANISGPGKNDKFEYYKWNGKSGSAVKYTYKKRSTYTYGNLAKAGLKKYWSINVKGTSYDFAKGVNFKTKVVLHSGDLPGQRYTNVIIGDTSNSAKRNGAFWHFASSYYYDKAPEYSFASNKKIYLVTQYQTAIKNKALKKYDYVCPESSPESYRNVAGHELGHNLGLRDGYMVGNLYRTVFTKEIGVVSIVKGKKKVKNIMSGARKCKANANDIEMALQAQGMAVNGKPKSFQSYKTYKENGKQFYKSPVIRMK